MKVSLIIISGLFVLSAPGFAASSREVTPAAANATCSHCAGQQKGRGDSVVLRMSLHEPTPLCPSCGSSDENCCGMGIFCSCPGCEHWPPMDAAPATQDDSSRQNSVLGNSRALVTTPDESKYLSEDDTPGRSPPDSAVISCTTLII